MFGEGCELRIHRLIEALHDPGNGKSEKQHDGKPEKETVHRAENAVEFVFGEIWGASHVLGATSAKISQHRIHHIGIVERARSSKGTEIGSRHAHPPWSSCIVERGVNESVPEHIEEGEDLLHNVAIFEWWNSQQAHWQGQEQNQANDEKHESKEGQDWPVAGKECVLIIDIIGAEVKAGNHIGEKCFWFGSAKDWICRAGGTVEDEFSIFVDIETMRGETGIDRGGTGVGITGIFRTESAR